MSPVLLSPNAKAYVSLIGSTATGLLAVFTSDTTIGKVLTVIAIVATAYGTFRVPNTPVVDVDKGEPESEAVIVTGSTPDQVEDALVSGNEPPVIPAPEAGHYDPRLNQAEEPHRYEE